jgi:beta-glucanase (GH16 family)
VEDRFLAPQTQSSTSSASETPSPSGGPAGQDADAYTLTFHDSFTDGLDRDAWNVDGAVSSDSTSNSSLNYAVSNGSLKMWPSRGSDGEFFKRTLDTHGRFSQRYGYFEMEAKLPKGSGVWPGFWMVGMNGELRPELDIMEAYPGGVAPWGAPDADGIPTAMMYGVALWRDVDDRAGYGKVSTPDLSAGFHRYGAKWEPNKVTYYFDGREVASVDGSLSEPMFMILSLWFGSASGDTNGSTPTGESNAFEVNYVKAWQFK